MHSFVFLPDNGKLWTHVAGVGSRVRLELALTRHKHKVETILDDG
ncbi:hypothetical protein OROMI_033389 [Orobanche minor]